MDKVEIIGIDHGWSNIKTAGSNFVSGIKEISTEPAFMKDIVEWKNKYYSVGGQRFGIKDTKVQDDSYYILTLAAIAEELERRGARRSKVILGVGLPLTRFGAEKVDFRNYLSRNGEMHYKYGGRQYHVILEKIYLFPQCYAAVAQKAGEYTEDPLIVDIGSWTIDIMPIINQLPDESKCKTIPKGLITCMRDINVELVRKLNGEAPETIMQEIMINGTSNVDIRYLEIIQSELHEFAKRIYATIKEAGYNVELTPIVFVGGGARVMKLFGEVKSSNISYIEDIRANAKGYEYLTKMALQGRGEGR